MEKCCISYCSFPISAQNSIMTKSTGTTYEDCSILSFKFLLGQGLLFCTTDYPRFTLKVFQPGWFYHLYVLLLAFACSNPKGNLVLHLPFPQIGLYTVQGVYSRLTFCTFFMLAEGFEPRQSASTHS